MTKCVHDIPYHGWTHETNLSSSSSSAFTGDILNSSDLSCRNHVPCSWFRVWNYNLQLNRPISQLIKLQSKWAVGRLPYGKEKLHLRIPMTLQKTLIGINYLELFLMSKNIYMKHECHNYYFTTLFTLGFWFPVLELLCSIYFHLLPKSTSFLLRSIFIHSTIKPRLKFMHQKIVV